MKTVAVVCLFLFAPLAIAQTQRRCAAEEQDETKCTGLPDTADAAYSDCIIVAIADHCSFSKVLSVDPQPQSANCEDCQFIVTMTWSVSGCTGTAPTLCNGGLQWGQEAADQKLENDGAVSKVFTLHCNDTNEGDPDGGTELCIRGVYCLSCGSGDFFRSLHCRHCFQVEGG